MSTQPTPAGHRHFVRRHLALTALGVVLLLLLGAVGGFAWYLNSELGNIRHFDAGIRPAAGAHGSTSDAGRPLDILVLGANDSANQTVADDLADGSWTPGVHRSDTVMLVHVPANRQSAQIVSIPRDGWVKVPTFPGDVHGSAKLDAAFSWGGPKLAVRTVQQLTGVHIDHVAIINWAGFQDLTDVLGGVRIYIPHTFTDDVQNVTWTKGWHTLNGYQALQYVRTRHGLADGDLGRIQRQQNFLRTIVGTLLSSGTFENPITLARAIGTFSSFIEVDDTWSAGDIRSLGFAMRHVGGSDVRFTTAPVGSFDDVQGQAIVRLDTARCTTLFEDFQRGDLAAYLRANPGSALPDDTSVK